MRAGGGPPWYHLPRLAPYEFLPIVAALAWAVRRGRRMRRSSSRRLLFAVASVAMYCYLGEKVPWLGVHQVWAFLPLAGLQLARTFGPHGVWWSRTLAAIGLAATPPPLVANFVLDEISPNRHGSRPGLRPDLPRSAAAGRREAMRLADEGEDPVAAVGGEVAWPGTWYCATTPVWWTEPARGHAAAAGRSV